MRPNRAKPRHSSSTVPSDLACFALADEEGALVPSRSPRPHLPLLGNDGHLPGPRRDEVAQAVPGAVAHQDGVRPVLPGPRLISRHGATLAGPMRSPGRSSTRSRACAGEKVVYVDDDVRDLLVQRPAFPADKLVARASGPPPRSAAVGGPRPARPARPVSPGGPEPHDGAAARMAERLVPLSTAPPPTLTTNGSAICSTSAMACASAARNDRLSVLLEDLGHGRPGPALDHARQCRPAPAQAGRQQPGHGRLARCPSCRPADDAAAGPPGPGRAAQARRLAR